MSKPVRTQRKASIKRAPTPKTRLPARADEEAMRAILAHNVRVARATVRMSQEELAERADTTQKYISAIEHMAANVGIDLLARIARHLGVSVAELLTPSPRGPQLPK